jgi:hypothetical protein
MEYYDFEKRRLLLIAQRNLKLLKINELKMKEFTAKIDKPAEVTINQILPQINLLIGLFGVIHNTRKSFDMFAYIPDKW